MQNPMVGGAAMYPTKNIVENAVNSKDHTTLVAAVKAAGLVDTLSGAGPFTVFAPTNAAFAKLPAGTVDTLLKPENKATLTKILTYHVVPGRITAADIAAKAPRPMAAPRRYDDRPGRHADLQASAGMGWAVIDGKGDTREDHHRQRDAVERRDPRHRHRAAAVDWRRRGRPASCGRPLK